MESLTKKENELRSLAENGDYWDILELADFLYDGKRYSTFPAVRADKTVDTTAAGDAFTAALTLEYLRCGDIREAIKVIKSSLLLK